MKSMYTYLKEMEGILFDETPEETSTVPADPSEPVFDELIPNSIAKELLEEKDYDSRCSYKLITTTESFIIEKFDPQKKEVISEYVIDPNDEVQSYEEMRKSVILGDGVPTIPISVPGDYRKSVLEDSGRIEDEVSKKFGATEIVMALIAFLIVAVAVLLHLYVGSI